MSDPIYKYSSFCILQRSRSLSTSTEEIVIHEEEEEEYFIPPFRPKKKDPPEMIQGTDWESVNYNLTKFECAQDEITGLAVSDSFIAVQFYIEANIHIHDTESGKLLFKLNGHEYGGSHLAIVDSYLYSGSMDCTVKSWDLKGKKMMASADHHADYVGAIAADRNTAASGGKGDKTIYVYEARNLSLKFKCSGHTGWITDLIIREDDDLLVSGSRDATIRTWNLTSGDPIRTMEQDAGISCLAWDGRRSMILFADINGKLSYCDDDETLHIIPNILIGTGRYCRSCKYHDKAIDTMHLTDNGYLITGSTGSKYMKIWKFDNSKIDWEKTEVKELQILRDHLDYLTISRVEGDSIYSSCSDGKIYRHDFPKGKQHFEMATEQEDVVNNAVMSSNGVMNEAPKNATEMCLGSRRCQTGKTGLVKSSSSFMVSIQLRPVSLQVQEKIKLPAIIPEEDEWNPSSDSDHESDSDEYEVVYVSDSEQDDSYSSKQEGSDF